MLYRIIFMMCIFGLLISPRSTTAQTIPLPTDLEVITPENAHRLVEVARIGNGQALYATWSPDGNQIAVATTIGVWLVSLDSPPRLLEGHRGLALDVAFRDDGLLLVAGDQHGTVYLWHGISGELLRRFESDLGEIARVKFSPDGTLFAAVNGIGTLNVWNIATGEIVFEYRSEDIVSSEIDLMFSPDGKYLAWTVSYWCCDYVDPWYFIGAGAWRLVDTQTYQQLSIPDWYSEQHDYRNSGSTLVFTSTSNPLILTMDNESNQTLQDFWTGEVIQPSENIVGFDKFEAHTYRDRPHISVADNGISIRMYRDGTNSFAVIPYAWTPSITYLALGTARLGDGETISDTYSLLIMYETSRIELKEITPQSISEWGDSGVQGSASAVVIKGYRGNAEVIVGTLGGTVLYSYSQEDFQLLQGHDAAITELAFLQADDPFNRDFVSNAQDGTVRLWRYDHALENFRHEILYQTSNEVRNMRYAPERNQLFFTENDIRCTEWCTQIIVYDLDLAQSRVLSTVEAEIRDGTFNHDGSKLAAVDENLFAFGLGGVSNDVLTLWDVNSGEALATLWDAPSFDLIAGEHPTVMSLEFSPDDRLLVAGYGECMAMGCGPRWYYSYIRIWNVETQEELVTLDAHTTQVTSILFTPDGKLMITGSRDGTVRFWGVPAGN